MRIIALRARGRRGMRLAIVDAISDGVARLEVGEGMRSVPAADLSPTAREGDVLRYRAGRWRKDAQLTRMRRERARSQLERLLRRSARMAPTVKPQDEGEAQETEDTEDTEETEDTNSPD